MRLLKEIDIKPYCKTIFLFNVGEEGAGNLRGIRYFFDHLPKSQRAKIKAHICLEGHRIGRLTKKVVGSHRRKIRVLTKGGHSWRDFGAPNAIVKAAQIIDQLNQIKLPLEPKTTLNIGIISGGTSVNSIAEKTELSMEIRYLEQDILFEIIKKLDDVLSKVSGAKIEMEVIGNRPCGEMKDQKLIKLIKDIHKALGIKTIDDIGSTDSNYPISLGLPSITIGISEAENTHSLNEYLFLPPIRKGLEQVIMVFEKLNNSF
jgi:acetylornithine deacetylase/succinyl-diaminopimelate desuccinylase-like protein